MKTGLPREKPLRAEKRTNNLNPHDTKVGNRTRATLVGGECSHHNTTTALSNGNISKDVYQKPTDTHTYLHWRKRVCNQGRMERQPNPPRNYNITKKLMQKSFKIDYHLLIFVVKFSNTAYK